jgi:hypothetical protein
VIDILSDLSCRVICAVVAKLSGTDKREGHGPVEGSTS